MTRGGTARDKYTNLIKPVGVDVHDDPFNRFKTYSLSTCHSERRKCHGVTFSKSNPTQGRAMRSIGIFERFMITRLKSNIMLSKVHQALCRSLRRFAACFPLGSFFASRKVRLRFASLEDDTVGVSGERTYEEPSPKGEGGFCEAKDG